MSFIRYAAALAATISLISASDANAQTAVQFGGGEMVLVGAALEGGAPAVAPRADVEEPARRRSGNPHPAASPTLLTRMGCADADVSPSRRTRAGVAVGMDACAALARYGQPSSTTFSDFGHTELVTMVWGNVGGSYGVHVAAVTYKDHPLTHGAGKQAEIGNWRITRHFGVERR